MLDVAVDYVSLNSTSDPPLPFYRLHFVQRSFAGIMIALQPKCKKNKQIALSNMSLIRFSKDLWTRTSSVLVLWGVNIFTVITTCMRGHLTVRGIKCSKRQDSRHLLLLLIRHMLLSDLVSLWLCLATGTLLPLTPSAIFQDIPRPDFKHNLVLP